MATKRVDTILERCLQYIRTQKDLRVTEPLIDVMMADLNEAQIDLCREYRALPHITTMKTEADQAFYGMGFPIAAIGAIVPPSGSELVTLEVIGTDTEWVEKKSNETNLTEPTYAFVFGDKIEFYPAPTVAGDEYTIYAYRYPERTVERGYDPEVGPEWDRALRLGVLRNYIPELEGAFNSAALQVAHSRMVRTTTKPKMVGSIANNKDLGF